MKHGPDFRLMPNCSLPFFFFFPVSRPSLVHLWMVNSEVINSETANGKRFASELYIKMKG